MFACFMRHPVTNPLPRIARRHHATPLPAAPSYKLHHATSHGATSRGVLSQHPQRAMHCEEGRARQASVLRRSSTPRTHSAIGPATS